MFDYDMFENKQKEETRIKRREGKKKGKDAWDQPVKQSGSHQTVIFRVGYTE